MSGDTVRTEGWDRKAKCWDIFGYTACDKPDRSCNEQSEEYRRCKVLMEGNTHAFDWIDSLANPSTSFVYGS